MLQHFNICIHIFLLALIVIQQQWLRVDAEIIVNKIITRIPKPKDIGLIFDVSLANSETEKKEMLEFRIRSDGCCCVNITNNDVICNIGRVVGGNFGYIEAGVQETVSLIWPTVSLYNRVGRCPIVITSTNPNQQQVQIKQLIRFDTRFETLDPEERTLRKQKDYSPCNNWDLDYFKNCTPVNCEERYFGQRSFYNTTSEQCEEIPRCDKSFVYDIYANECVDTTKFCSEEDLQLIRQGKFQEFMTTNKKPIHPSAPRVVVNIPEDEINRHLFAKRKANWEDAGNANSFENYTANL